MIRSKRARSSRRALIASRLAILIFPAALAVGCSDDDSDGPPPTATATAPAAATVTATPAAPTNTAAPTLTPTGAPNADLAAACQKLTACGECFINQYGNCLSAAECVSRLAADAAICINQQSGCDQASLGDCLFLGCDGADATAECG